MAITTYDDLQAVKQFMRVDGEDDDLVIRSLYAAAKLYLKKAGIEEPEAEPELFNLAVWSLTLHYYDHRDAIGNEAAIPVGLRPIINQLKQEGEILRSITT